MITAIDQILNLSEPDAGAKNFWYFAIRIAVKVKVHWRLAKEGKEEHAPYNSCTTEQQRRISCYI